MAHIEPQIFLRQASGLVKTARAWDVAIYNLGLCSVGIALTLAHSYVPFNYRGASLPFAALFAAGLFSGSKELTNLSISVLRPEVTFLIGASAIVLSAWILLRGMRAFFRFQNVLFVLAIGGTFCAVFALLGSNHIEFVRRFAAAYSLGQNVAVELDKAP